MRKRSEREVQRQSQWQEIVRRQGDSGQSVRAYCRQARIEESAFYWWRRELARRSQPSSERAASTRKVDHGGSNRLTTQRPLDTASPAGFLSVRVTADHDCETPRPIEIVLGRDRVLRIPLGFDRQTLQDVLSALEGREC
jgi:hypothetical protein